MHLSFKMVLKCALVLCLVFVFNCRAFVLRTPPPPYDSSEYYRPFRSYGGFYPHRGISIESDESEEYLQKEYGIAPKPHTTYFVSSHNLSWENARDECKARGMVMASPTSQGQKWDLEEYLQTNSLEPADQYSGYWIGGKRMFADEPWIWEVDGQEVKPPGWLPGEPNGYDGEDCMEFKYDHMSGWNNYYCSALKRFICQSKPHIRETAKNYIKNSQPSHIHEETLKEKFYNPDNKKTKDSLNIVTSTATTTTTTGHYHARFPYRFVQREPIRLFHSRPSFYHTEGPSFTMETSSEPSSTTDEAQTEFTTLEGTAQTQNGEATKSTITTNLVPSTEKAEEISSLSTRVSINSDSVAPWTDISSTERSINMEQSTPDGLDTSVSTDIIVDPLVRRYQELEQRSLHDIYADSNYEDYL